VAWIFWLNVPIGVGLIPLALQRLDETHGRATALDLLGLALASAGLTGIVWGLVRGNSQGWTSTEIVAALTAGAFVVAAFVVWELRAKEPMLPMRFFRNRGFALANVASLLMFFGMFGSIFLLTQFFQTVRGYSALGSGLRILPWTLMPMFVAPVAGALSDRIGGARLMGIGLTLQAGGLASLTTLSTPTVPYWQLVAPFMVSGVGMAMFWAPVANVVLAAVHSEEEGQASGAQSAIRELGGVFGVAVLASVLVAVRQLPDRRDVRRRDAAGAVDRRGRRPARRAGRLPHPAAQPRARGPGFGRRRVHRSGVMTWPVTP
jgi:EmrB/QacA subfamily drug resistance transporter